MLNQARAILAAREEGRVQAVVSMYEHGVIDITQLRMFMEKILGFASEEVDYWLDYHSIEH
jgi:hypothetical protein